MQCKPTILIIATCDEDAIEIGGRYIASIHVSNEDPDPGAPYGIGNSPEDAVKAYCLKANVGFSLNNYNYRSNKPLLSGFESAPLATA